MNRTILLLTGCIAFSIFSTSCEKNDSTQSFDNKSPNTVDESKIQERAGVYYTINSNTPFTGVSVAKHDNGQISKKRNYLEGKLHGKETWWHENGQVEAEVSFHKGTPQGTLIGWHENGAKEKSIPIENGQVRGLISHWYDNGVLKATYHINEVIDGKVTLWHKNGNKCMEFTVMNNTLNGDCTILHKDGSLKMKTVLKNNKFHGEADLLYQKQGINIHASIKQSPEGEYLVDGHQSISGFKIFLRPDQAEWVIDKLKDEFHTTLDNKLGYFYLRSEGLSNAWSGILNL